MSRRRLDHFYHGYVNIPVISTLLKPLGPPSSLGYPSQMYRQKQQSRCATSFKVRRRRRRKMDELRAELEEEDQPDVMDKVVYITTVEEADEWAKTAVVDHITKLINTSQTILAGVYAIWENSPKDQDDTANVLQEADPGSTDKSHHEQARSMLGREKDIFVRRNDPYSADTSQEEQPLSLQSHESDVGEQEDDPDDEDLLQEEEEEDQQQQLSETDVALQEDDQGTTDIPPENQLLLLQISIPKAPVAVFDFAAMRRNAQAASSDDQVAPRMKFPKYLKYVLQLPTLIVCAVEANALVDKLLLHCKVDCLTRADLVDMARCALSYQEGFESTASFDFEQNASAPAPAVLDELFYQFFGPVNRDEVLHFERPPVDAPYFSREDYQPLSEGQMRYYAAHAYHSRLLAATMIETIDFSEAALYHEDDEAFVYLNDPNIPFHPTMDRLPEMLCYGKKVALLTEIDDEYDDETRRLTGSRKHRIMATGRVEFVGEPYGITRRFPGTSYLVGQHEEEAIVRLKKVPRTFGLVPLCRGYKYWQHPSQDGDKTLDWPDSPTLAWVLENAKPAWIVVEKSRLELMDHINDIPTEKPWMTNKKADEPLKPPLDVSKFM
jgi:hypothetical protein